jgi:hypothetical protein
VPDSRVEGGRPGDPPLPEEEEFVVVGPRNRPGHGSTSVQSRSLTTAAASNSMPATLGRASPRCSSPGSGKPSSRYGATIQRRRPAAGARPYLDRAEAGRPGPVHRVDP